MYLALGALLGTSGSNSTGKPKKPLNRSKVTCATCRTLVGHPISMLQSSLRLLLQATRDLLKMATRSASSEICWPSPPSSSSSPSSATLRLKSSKSWCCSIEARKSTSWGNPGTGLRRRWWSEVMRRVALEREADGEGEEDEEALGDEGKWRTSVMARLQIHAIENERNRLFGVKSCKLKREAFKVTQREREREGRRMEGLDLVGNINCAINVYWNPNSVDLLTPLLDFLD